MMNRTKNTTPMISGMSVGDSTQNQVQFETGSIPISLRATNRIVKRVSRPGPAEEEEDTFMFLDMIKPLIVECWYYNRSDQIVKRFLTKNGDY